jgi:hypothetical protein
MTPTQTTCGSALTTHDRTFFITIHPCPASPAFNSAPGENVSDLLMTRRCACRHWSQKVPALSTKNTRAKSQLLSGRDTSTAQRQSLRSGRRSAQHDNLEWLGATLRKARRVRHCRIRFVHETVINAQSRAGGVRRCACPATSGNSSFLYFAL